MPQRTTFHMAHWKKELPTYKKFASMISYQCQSPRWCGWQGNQGRRKLLKLEGATCLSAIHNGKIEA